MLPEILTLSYMYSANIDDTSPAFTIESYHSSRIIMVSVNTEDWQAHIEVRIFIVYMTKSATKKLAYVSFSHHKRENHSMI